MSPLYPAKPAQGERDAHTHGARLFYYLLRGVVDRLEVYGMLTDDELALALHASTNALTHDASDIALERVASVRYRIGRILLAREAERIEHGISGTSHPPIGAPGTSVIPLKPAPKVNPPAQTAAIAF